MTVIRYESREDVLTCLDFLVSNEVRVKVVHLDGKNLLWTSLRGILSIKSRNRAWECYSRDDLGYSIGYTQFSIDTIKLIVRLDIEHIIFCGDAGFWGE